MDGIKELYYAELVKAVENFSKTVKEKPYRFLMVHWCISTYGHCDEMMYDLIQQLYFDGFIYK